MVFQLIILLIAWGLRLWNLDAQGFWNDEGYGAYLAHQDWSHMTWDDVVHPPLFNYFMHFWLLVGEEEWVLRWVPVAFGLIAVATVYAVARRLVSPPAATVAALLMAVAPQMVYYSQEMRPHMAGVALAWLAVAALLRLLDPSRPSHGRVLSLAICYWAFNVLSCLTLYFTALLAVAAGGWASARVVLGKGGLSTRQLWAWFLATAAAVAVLFGWLIMAAPTILFIAGLRGPVFGGRPTPLEDLLARTLVGWAVGPATTFSPEAWYTQPVVLTLLFLALWGLAAYGRRGPWGFYLLPLAVIIPPLSLWIIDQRVPHFQPRYLAVSAPALYILAAQGAVALGHVAGRVKARASLGVTVALSMIVLGLWWGYLQTLWHDPRYARDDYRGITAYLAARAAPGDALVLDAYWQEGTITYYFQRYEVRLPLYGFPTEFPLDEARAERRLREIVANHTGVWLLLYGQASLDPQNLVERWLDSHARRVEERWFGEPRLVRYDLPQGPLPPQNLSVRVGPLTLLGYQASPAVADGRPIGLRLAWRLDTPMAEPPHISLRLEDVQGRLWAQSDYRLRPEASGEVFLDAPAIALPAGTPPGRYRLRLVAYTREGELGAATPGELEVQDAPGVPRLNRIRRELINLVDMAFGGVVLIGSRLPAPNPSSAVLRPQQVHPYDLLWLWTEAGRQGLTLRVELMDQGGKVLAKEEQPLQTTGSPRLIRAIGGVRVPATAEGQVLTLRITVLDDHGQPRPIQRVFYWNDWARPIPMGPALGTSLNIGSLYVQGRPRNYALPADIGWPRGERFGEGIRLVGTRLDTTIPSRLRLTLIWQCLGPMDGDYKVFTHLLDAQGRIVGQDDGVPLRGDAPTSTWRRGEVLEDLYEIPVPGTGLFRLVIGLYDPATGQRLPVTDAAGNPLGDSLSLGEMMIR